MTNATQALSSALLYILSGTAMSMCGLLTMLAGAIYGTIILLASAGKMLVWVPHDVVCSSSESVHLAPLPPLEPLVCLSPEPTMCALQESWLG